MTLDMFIERLQELREEAGGDVEVRLATQPNYPLEHAIGGAGLFTPDAGEEVVYIGEGRQLGYLTAGAAEAAWS